MKKKIEKIKLTAEQREEVNKMMKGEPIRRVKLTKNHKRGYEYEYTTNRTVSREMARRRLTQLFWGTCTVCKQWPDYRVTYDVGDSKQPAKRIERYCSTYYKKWRSKR